MVDTEYLCETRLKALSPELHTLFSNTAFVAYHMLENYATFFPDYTDHAVTHSMQVIRFCNELIGEENIEKLNADELYILLMSCYLHDCGMGIPKDDYRKLRDRVVSEEYRSEHPDETVDEVIRNFHQEFSGELIRKYAPLFEIPGDAYVQAIVQVSRGHRRINLYDDREFPVDYRLPNGNTVCLPYLASLIRLADELDIAADRNISFVFAPSANIEKRRHAAIKHMRIEKDRFVLEYRTDEEILIRSIAKASGKLQETLTLCRDVIETRTHFSISQRFVEVENMDRIKVGG